ncbi:hypothetical protein BVX99_01480 [bacterium F16]|nr:hypothetical protein BVX99_01480 [bacterium F16]
MLSMNETSPVELNPTEPNNNVSIDNRHSHAQFTLIPSEETEETNTLPTVLLPGGEIRIIDAAEQLGLLLADTGEIFVRGGVVHQLRQTGKNGEYSLVPVKAAMLCSAFEHVATLKVRRKSGDGHTDEPTTCSKAKAESIMTAREFKEQLTEIKVVTSYPVLVEKNGVPAVITGLDEELGILANGTAPEEMELSEAVGLLLDLLGDFSFQKPSDLSRALSFLISPALGVGGLINERIPFQVCEADKSQSGKGFLLKLCSAIYGETPTVVTQKGHGVGSIRESFDHALVSGRPFISLDNVRGKVDCPALESFLTEDVYLSRIPYHGSIEINPSKYVICLTSNNAEMTRDLSNRCCTCRIRKQPDDYQFKRYSEGSVLEHVRANQHKYLGAVYTVLKVWYEMGKPTTDENRHARKEWVGSMDWMVQYLFHCAPLMDDHLDIQDRMCSVYGNWLRDVAVAVVNTKPDEPLKVHEICEICYESGINLNGSQDISNQMSDAHVGRKLNAVFKGHTQTEIDGIMIHRDQVSERDDRSRERSFHVYTFCMQ